MGMLLGLILFPIAAVLFLIFAGMAFHMIHESPVLWWTFVGFIVFFTPVFMIAGYNDFKRRKEIARWNKEQAAKKATGA